MALKNDIGQERYLFDRIFAMICEFFYSHDFKDDIDNEPVDCQATDSNRYT